MADLKKKLETLNEISQTCLASLLKYEVSGKTFVDPNGNSFTTPTNEEALGQYLNKKQPAVLSEIKRNRSINKNGIYLDDKYEMIRTKIIVFELDHTSSATK